MSECKDCFWFVKCALGDAEGFCLFHCVHVNPEDEACELFVKSEPIPTCMICKHFIRVTIYDGICILKNEWCSVFTPACDSFETWE